MPLTVEGVCPTEAVVTGTLTTGRPTSAGGRYGPLPAAGELASGAGMDCVATLCVVVPVDPVTPGSTKLLLPKEEHPAKLTAPTISAAAATDRRNARSEMRYLIGLLVTKFNSAE